MKPPFALPAVTTAALMLSAQAIAQDHAQYRPQATEPSAADHAAMGHSMPSAQDEPREAIPALTDADRAAAFPAVGGHAAHDADVVSFAQFDRLETWDADDGAGLLWNARGWVGTDVDKVWLRSEGERIDGETEAADVELLYGRAVARWWDVVAGVRHELEPGPERTWIAIGVTGLAPQKFEVEATAYIGDAGRTAARFEVEYEMLLTNRLILQPLLELNLLGEDDPERGLGSGLTTSEAGLRLRYEITRQFAPYVGVVYESAFGETADLRRAGDKDVEDTRIVAGLRLWF